MHADLDPGPRTLPSRAFNPHAIVVAEQDLEAFVDVADANSLLEQRRELRLRNAHAIVLHRQVQTCLNDAAAHANLTAIHFAAETVLDAVFDDRLQQHEI